MSKHSMRRGSDGRREHGAQRLERVVVRGDGLVEARLVGELRRCVRRDRPGRASRRAAARRCGRGGRRARSATPRALRVSDALSATGRWISGGAPRSVVELLERRLQHVASRSTPRRSPASRSPRSGRQLDALDDPAAAHLEDLDDDAGGPDLQAEHVAIAELARRHLLLALAAASRPCASRRAAAPPPRSARRPAASIIRSRSVVDQLVVAPFEEQLRVAAPRARTRSAMQIVVDARRDAALDVVLEARPRRACR